MKNHAVSPSLCDTIGDQYHKVHNYLWYRCLYVCALGLIWRQFSNFFSGLSGLINVNSEPFFFVDAVFVIGI